MNELLFENSYGERRVIATCKNRAEVNNAINAFVRACNKNKPEDKQSKVHYMRFWEEDGMMKIDVGSHTEFFYAPLEFYQNI